MSHATALTYICLDCDEAHGEPLKYDEHTEPRVCADCRPRVCECCDREPMPGDTVCRACDDRGRAVCDDCGALNRGAPLCDTCRIAAHGDYLLDFGR